MFLSVHTVKEDFNFVVGGKFQTFPIRLYITVDFSSPFSPSLSDPLVRISIGFWDDNVIPSVTSHEKRKECGNLAVWSTTFAFTFTHNFNERPQNLILFFKENTYLHSGKPWEGSTSISSTYYGDFYSNNFRFLYFIDSI